MELKGACLPACCAVEETGLSSCQRYSSEQEDPVFMEGEVQT